jgi:hypothetical protein
MDLSGDFVKIPGSDLNNLESADWIPRLRSNKIIAIS